MPYEEGENTPLVKLTHEDQTDTYVKTFGLMGQ